MIKHKLSITIEISVKKTDDPFFQPFVCVECGKGFARTDYLSKHSKIHVTSSSVNDVTNDVEDHHAPSLEVLVNFLHIRLITGYLPNLYTQLSYVYDSLKLEMSCLFLSMS